MIISICQGPSSEIMLDFVSWQERATTFGRQSDSNIFVSSVIVCLVCTASFLFLLVLIRASIPAMKHHDQNASWGERVYFAYTFKLLFIIERSLDRISHRAETCSKNGAAAMEECCSLAFWLSFLIEPRTTGGWHHLPPSINH